MAPADKSDNTSSIPRTHLVEEEVLVPKFPTRPTLENLIPQSWPDFHMYTKKHAHPCTNRHNNNNNKDRCEIELPWFLCVGVGGEERRATPQVRQNLNWSRVERKQWTKLGVWWERRVRVGDRAGLPGSAGSLQCWWWSAASPAWSVQCHSGPVVFDPEAGPAQSAPADLLRPALSQVCSRGKSQERTAWVLAEHLKKWTGNTHTLLMLRSVTLLTCSPVGLHHS